MPSGARSSRKVALPQSSAGSSTLRMRFPICFGSSLRGNLPDVCREVESERRAARTAHRMCLSSGKLQDRPAPGDEEPPEARLPMRPHVAIIAGLTVAGDPEARDLVDGENPGAIEGGVRR